MDINLVVLNGRLAAAPEIREFESGNRLARLLVTVRSLEPRRRVDVVPVTLWDPPDGLANWEPDPETRVWIVATVQRRFSQHQAGRRSRLEVVAHSIQIGEDPGETLESAASDPDGGPAGAPH